MSILNDVETLLGIEDEGGKLALIIKNTEKRLLAKLDGEEEVPEELDYIVTEVAVARFNRIGSEGTSNHGVEGESMTWSADDFAPFEDEIKEWLAAREKTGKGTVRFL